MANPSQDILWLRNRALDSTKVSVAIADARAHDLPLIDVNTAFVRLTGYQSEEILGKNCRFLQGARTSKQLAGAMREGIQEARESRVVILNYRKDGRPFWNEVNISPVYDYSGTLTHFVSSQMDVTEQVRDNQFRQLLNEVDTAAADRHDQTSMLEPVAQLVIETIADACMIHLIGDDGTVVQMASLTSKPLSNHPILEQAIRAEMTTSEVPLIIRICIESGKLSSTRFGWGDDPAAARFGIVVAPIVGPSKLFGAISFAVDEQVRQIDESDQKVAAGIGHRIGSLFEMNQLYSDLQAAADVRDEFLSIAAHELRTPISSIKGYSQLLLRGLERGTLLPERLRLGLKTIEKSASRLTILTNDLLEVSRAGMNHLPLHLETISAFAYVSSFLSERHTLRSDSHDFELISEDPNVLVSADIGRLDQVMSNLTSNAVKYSPADHPVELEIIAERNGVSILVRDFGMGLVSADLERVFLPFQRANAATSSSIPGMGLGLFISRNIVDRHGGTLTAASDGPGTGTTFQLWLPAVQPPDTSVELMTHSQIA